MTRKPIVALIYDFDGTLSPGNMQEFGFIQAIGKTPEEFWDISNRIASGQDASSQGHQAQAQRVQEIRKGHKTFRGARELV